jgi:predicted anti-sigma-YlaC factor YlaD
MKCNKVRKIMPSALTGEMDDLTRHSFNKHLDACDGCRCDFKEVSGTWNQLVIPKQAQVAKNAPLQLKLFSPRRILLKSIFLNRAVTAAIVAAIIILLILPFIIAKPKQNNPKWQNQNASQSASVGTKQN